MGVGKWELNGELHESLGTAAGSASKSNSPRTANDVWELGVGKWELRLPAAVTRSLMQLRVYDGD